MLPNLKKLRNERGITQQYLGISVGISQQSINQYENNSIEPDIFTLSKLADYFNTSIDYIVGRTDIRRPIEHTEPYFLNPKEMELIQRYRDLNERERACVNTVVETLQEK